MSMFDHLESFIDDIQKENFEGGLFTTFKRKERAMKSIQEEMAAFIWSHIFKVLIIKMPCDSLDARQEMLAECRAYYRNNVIQLLQIDEFERTYKANDAICWYTKPGFLFYLVNKALRSGDMLALYTFRYFIKDLCNQLEEASTTYTNTSFRVYRGAKLHRNELESLQIGYFVTSNSFLSCSRDRSIAEMFISIDPLTGRSPSNGRHEKQQYVLFEIDVNLANFPDTIVANVSTQSELPSENEMIFMLGSTFAINSIVYDSQKYLWFVQMNSLSDITQKRCIAEQYMHQRLQETSPIVFFGTALISIQSDYICSLEYYHRLLRTLPITHINRPDIYYSLGRIYRYLEKYEKAVAYFRCAQLLLRRLLPQRICKYCRVLGGIGSAYASFGDSTRAIKRLKQAITLQHNHLPDNHIIIPFNLNRLGYAYFSAKEFELALTTLHKAGDFFQTRMSIHHQGHIQTLYTLGLVYRALGDNEKAYEHFKEALCNCDLLLIKDHPDVASTCYQLSLIHEERDEYELALEYARRSLYIRSIKLPYYHSGLKQSIQLVERLEKHQKILHST